MELKSNVSLMTRSSLKLALAHLAINLMSEMEETGITGSEVCDNMHHGNDTQSYKNNILQSLLNMLDYEEEEDNSGDLLKKLK